MVQQEVETTLMVIWSIMMILAGIAIGAMGVWIGIDGDCAHDTDLRDWNGDRVYCPLCDRVWKVK